MNKRITELMIEAVKTIPGDKHIDADFCNKFAELIVQEAIEVAKNAQSLEAAAMITMHFGMRE